MNKIFKISSLAIAFTLIVQPFFQVHPTLANSDQIISRTNFSETTRNMDMTNKIEIFPSPIYTKDSVTGKLVPNREAEKGNYPLFQASISESTPTENLSAEQKLIAGTANEKQYTTLLKFGDELPDLDGGLISRAELNLFEIDKPVKWGYGDPTYIDRSYSIHKVLSSWAGDTISWETKPQLSEPYTSKTMDIGKDGGHFKWDVTKMVAEWYQNSSSDFGLAIKGNEEATDNLRSFYTSKGYSNKSYSQTDKAPRLTVDYSPRPEITSRYGDGLDLNSNQAYVNLSWSKQKGVKGYKLSIFNGKTYETIDVGQSTSWTSLNKKLWPSAEEIKNGAYQLKLDGSGTNLSSNPGLLYENAGNTTKDSNRYYFRLTAYNEFGESGASEEVSVAVPDRTAPDKVSNVEITTASPSGLHVKWDNLQDAKDYRVNVGSTPGGSDIASNVKTATNEIFITSDKFLPRRINFVSVEAVDESGNYSGYTSPVSAVIKNKKDAEIISIPFSHSVESDPIMSITVKNTGSESWILEKGYELKMVSGDIAAVAEPLLADEAVNSGEIKTFQVRFNGKRPLGEVLMKWQMHQQNNGFFGYSSTKSILFYDSNKPEVNIQLPEIMASLYKVVDIKGTVNDATLKEYKLFYGSGTAPSSWQQISSGSTIVENKILGRWDTTGLASGTYTLKLEAIDEAGNLNAATKEVKVNLPVTQPVAKEITDKTTRVTGATAFPGLTVYIKKGIEVLGSDVAESDGSFSIPISKQQSGTKLTLYAENEFGISSKTVSLTVKDATPPKAPQVHAVAENSIKVSGTAEKGSTIIVSKGSSVIGSGLTGANGTFSVAISKQTAGAKLQVKAKDDAKNLSAESTVTVIDKTPPPTPSANTIADYSTSVKGTAEKSTVIAIKKGNSVIGTGKANKDGLYTVAIPKQKAGTVLTITAKDSAGNTSGSAKKTVVDKTAPSVPTVKTVYANAEVVSGKTEPYAIVTVKKGSITLGSTKASATGVFTVKIKSQSKRTVLSVSAKDAAGNQSKNASFTVK